MSAAVKLRAEAITSVRLPAGRRERNKREKAERIVVAATRMFHSLGYRETTMNMIASAAAVAHGTLFLYARDKRELLLRIINDELDVLSANAIAAVDRDAPVVEQLMQVFAPRYAYWGVDPDLSLHALQEVLRPQPGDEDPTSQYARYQGRRDQLIANVAGIIADQQRLGAIRPDEDASTLGDLCMAVHLSVVRSWLRRGAPAAASGVGDLRRLLSTAMRAAVTGSLRNTD